MVDGSSRFWWKCLPGSQKLILSNPAQQSTQFWGFWLVLIGVSSLPVKNKKRGDPGFFLCPVFQMESHETNIFSVQILGKRFCYRSWIEIIVEGFPCLKRIISRRGLPRSLVTLHIGDKHRKSSTSQLVKSFQIPSVKLVPLQKKISDFAGI